MARGGSNIILYIMVFVSSVVGISLLPDFAGYCATAAADGNITGTITETVVNLLPMLYGVICIAGMVGPIYKLFR